MAKSGQYWTVPIAHLEFKLINASPNSSKVEPEGSNFCPAKLEKLGVLKSGFQTLSKICLEAKLRQISSAEPNMFPIVMRVGACIRHTKVSLRLYRIQSLRCGKRLTEVCLIQASMKIAMEHIILYQQKC